MPNVYLKPQCFEISKVLGINLKEQMNAERRVSQESRKLAHHHHITQAYPEVDPEQRK